MAAGRSVVEIIVLMLTGTVCTCIVLSGISIAVIEIVNPAVDTSVPAAALSNVLIGLLGAVLGLLAGKSERGKGLHTRQDGSQDEL